jgi:hypothetical protein
MGRPKHHAWCAAPGLHRLGLCIGVPTYLSLKSCHVGQPAKLEEAILAYSLHERYILWKWQFFLDSPLTTRI